MAPSELVGSYPTVSPLPLCNVTSGRFVFCGPYPYPDMISGRSLLATSLPCGVRTFLHPDITSGQRLSCLTSANQLSRANHGVYPLICQPVCFTILFPVYMNNIISIKMHQQSHGLFIKRFQSFALYFIFSFYLLYHKFRICKDFDC